MSDELARALLVAGALALALALAWWARRRTGRHGPPADVRGLTTGPGAVIFTKEDCPSCAATLAHLETLDIPIRQVRAEDDPGELERRGVTGVPITVIIDATGRPQRQFAGLPPLRPLRRAVRRAREIPGARPRGL